MPTPARYFVKCALAWLVAGGVIGAVGSSQPLGLPPGVAALRPMGWHLLVVGWATQLIFGVAFWMFPLLGKEQPRGDERLVWAVFFALNAGLMLRAVGEPLSVLSPGRLWSVVLPLSATLQFAAVALFAIVTWPRVRSIERRLPRPS